MKKVNSVESATTSAETGALESRASDTGDHARKRYTAPKLESWGSLKDLTQGAPAGSPEAFGGGSTT